MCVKHVVKTSLHVATQADVFLRHMSVTDIIAAETGLMKTAVSDISINGCMFLYIKIEGECT